MTRYDDELQHTLTNIAQEDILDVDLWPTIQEQLKQKPQPTVTRRRGFFWLRAGAIAAIFLLMSAVGYAFYQSMTIDNTLPDEQITMLNQTQTVDGLTLTLDYAYADVHRASVGYSYEMETGQTGLQAREATLQTADGIVLPRTWGGGGGGGTQDSPSSHSTTLNFSTLAINDDRQQLNLTLTLELAQSAPMARPQDTPSGQGGGGGGGGGGGQAPPPDIASPDATRTYTFEFSVPLLDAFTFDDAASDTTDDDLMLTVRNVEITPAVVRFQTCYTPPNDVTNPQADDFWRAVPLVEAGDSHAVALPPVQPDVEAVWSEDGQICNQWHVPMAVNDDADELVITVPYLINSMGDDIASRETDENAMRSEAILAEYGLVVDVVMASETDAGGDGIRGVEIDRDASDPDALELFDTGHYIVNVIFSELYDVNWSVTFDLPG